MDMLRQSLALGFQLSALLLGSYYCHKYLAKALDWDPNLVLVGLIMASFAGWLTHVYVFYERKYKNH